MASLVSSVASFLLGAVSAKGWAHESIRWSTLQGGKKTMAKEGKPAMIVVHNSRCSACLQLKQKFKNNPDVLKLAKEFVMINIEDESEDQIYPNLNVDGGYTPRIMFMDPQGNILKQIKNTNSEHGKYFHTEAATLEGNMRSCLNITRKKHFIMVKKHEVIPLRNGR